MKFCSIFLVVLVFLSCKEAPREEKDNENPIVFSEVARIEISNHTSSDTIAVITKQLSKTQIADFVNRWNNAKSNGLCKYSPQFEIAVTLKDSSILNFRISSEGTIKANNDLCFSFKDSTYFRNLWQ